MGARTTTTWIADSALLPTGWARDVELTIGETGRFTRVAPRGPAGTSPSDGNQTTRIRGAVIPAMPNLHSHAFQRGLVGRTEARSRTEPSTPPDDFWSWRAQMYTFLGQLDPEAVESFAAMVYAEMLLEGYGSVAEFHYVHHTVEGTAYNDPLEISKRILRAAERTGIRVTLVPVVYEAAGFGGVPLEPSQRRFSLDAHGVIGTYEALTREFATGTHSFGLGLHSLRAASPGAVEAVGAWSTAHPGVPVHIHVAEQRAEVEASVAWSGQRPMEWLLEHAPVDDRWCLVHATHLTPRELEHFAETGAVAGLCPTTEADLGDGVFSLEDFERAGGRWGIGSDSQVSVSPPAELRTLEYGQRLLHTSRRVAGRGGDGTQSTGQALVDAALSAGASVLGQDVGRIEVGACADLVVLDSDHPRLVGLDADSLLDGWIFGSAHGAVRDVMVDGQWVVRDRKHIDWDNVVEQHRDTTRRLAVGG